MPVLLFVAVVLLVTTITILCSMTATLHSYGIRQRQKHVGCHTLVWALLLDALRRLWLPHIYVYEALLESGLGCRVQALGIYAKQILAIGV